MDKTLRGKYSISPKHVSILFQLSKIIGRQVIHRTIINYLRILVVSVGIWTDDIVDTFEVFHSCARYRGPQPKLPNEIELMSMSEKKTTESTQGTSLLLQGLPDQTDFIVQKGDESCHSL